MKPRTHTFRGVKYAIRWVPHLRENAADCEVGEAEKVIRISLNALKEHPEETLTTYVHEALHACFGDLDEDSVERSAVDIARFLQRLGYERNA